MSHNLVVSFGLLQVYLKEEKLIYLHKFQNQSTLMVDEIYFDCAKLCSATLKSKVHKASVPQFFLMCKSSMSFLNC